MKFHEGVLDIVAEFNDTNFTLELGEKALLLAPAFYDAKMNCDEALKRYEWLYIKNIHIEQILI